MKLQSWLFLLLPLLLIIGCKKEDVPTNQTDSTLAKSDMRRLDPGFAENDMVMYWNEKIATVLSVGMTQPTRARLFAIMHIAMHDALNSIKPKFQTYA